MVKKIIFRVICGVLILLIMQLINKSLIGDVYAENIGFTPSDIVVVTTGSNNTYSVTTNTWNNETVYAFPTTVPTDWSGNDGTIYFRYPQFNGANYCSGTSNNGSISGRIYNGSRNLTGNVRLEDRVNNSYYNCNTEINGTMASFTCNNANLSHSLNILITGANGGRYGISRLLDINCTMTNEGLANVINGGNQTIINNNNQNTNSIINNNNQNTQSIINNNNQNTQQQIESQKVCKIYSKDNIKIDNTYLSINGSEISSNVWGITKYISLNDSTKIIVKSIQSTNGNLCFYDNDKTLLSCVQNAGLNVNDVITIANNSSYVRFSINKNTNTPQFQVCSNGNQSIVDSTNELNDNITSTDISGSEGAFNNLIGTDTNWTPISNLITLPLTLLNAYMSGFDSTCTPVNLGNLYGTNLILPCINPVDYLGSTLWGTIDLIISIFLIYNIGMMCISMYDRLTSLDDGFQDLYTPQHASYQPKHGGGN